MEVIREFTNNITVGQVIGVVVAVVAAITGIIEFNNKIKSWPISSALQWIGSKTNKGLYDRMDELESKVNDLAEKQRLADERDLEQEAINCRVRILQFSDELRSGVRHSEESFNQVLSDIDNYEHYCNEHPDFKNKRTVMAKKRIEAAYDGCMEQNDFL